MCDVCGCGMAAPHTSSVKVMDRLLARNEANAVHNRSHFDRAGVLAVNLMSSPGAGKTALLEASVDALKHEFRIAVITGDPETDNDARRIRAKGVPAIQIATGGACHLDAAMVHRALHNLSLKEIDILFIENVGNLVCPACFDLGQHHNVVLLCATEGDDKPAKYPVMFRGADAMLITKADLLPWLDDFDPARAHHFMRELTSAAPVFSLSARKGIGMDAWFAWLREARGRRADIAFDFGEHE